MPPAQNNPDAAVGQVPLHLRRILQFDGALNVRDLGGVTNSIGQQVKFGIAYRSDDLAELSALDLAELEKRSVQTIVDFRSSEEVEARPSRLPPGATVVSAPFARGERTAGEVMESMIAGKLTREDAHQILLDSYRHIAEIGSPAFALLIRAIIDRSPVLFHCAGGKDRTGVATAVILSILGVDRDQIVEDYMLTNDRLADQSSTFQLRLAGYPEESRDVLLALGLAKPDYIELALDVIDRDFGGIDAYAQVQLTLTQAEVDALRNLLLEP
ncbi:tyrosine-protein phosphatase [Candidatus Poriferisocius sp.]|uniref:tyrosine-protein phosphatase n=1 Tax=Candidatus Poriferisocius sp. TaxID=3101276 RepID=UPI003B01E0BF